MNRTTQQLLRRARRENPNCAFQGKAGLDYFKEIDLILAVRRLVTAVTYAAYANYVGKYISADRYISGGRIPYSDEVK